MKENVTFNIDYCLIISSKSSILLLCLQKPLLTTPLQKDSCLVSLTFEKKVCFMNKLFYNFIYFLFFAQGIILVIWIYSQLFYTIFYHVCNKYFSPIKRLLFFYPTTHLSGLLFFFFFFNKLTIYQFWNKFDLPSNYFILYFHQFSDDLLIKVLSSKLKKIVCL